MLYRSVAFNLGIKTSPKGMQITLRCHMTINGIGENHKNISSTQNV